MIGKSLVYVAYSPYENQGKVLDFILANFEKVFLFSVGHYDLRAENKTDTLLIYKNGEVIGRKKLLHIPIPSSLVFSILPFRSLLNFIQILIFLFWLFVRFGKIDMYFSVNGYAAWMGLIFKRMGIVRKTSFWVCDYYPMYHKNKIIRFTRMIFREFEKFSAKSDILTFHNKRLVKVWKERRLISGSIKFPLVPIGTEKSRLDFRRKRDQVTLVFLGVLKKSQGLDYIFNSAANLVETFPNIKLNILGPGPDTEYFKRRAKTTKLKTRFYGYVREKQIEHIISHSTIGIAPYIPDPTSVSYYGDPGKIKRYISLGLPVVATNIHEFSRQIEKSNAGVLVHYNDPKELIKAIKKINSNYQTMSKNAINLNEKYYYRKLYPKMFAVPQ